MKSFWWMAVLAVLLLPVDAMSQTLGCTRIDTNTLIASTATWVQDFLSGQWFGSVNNQNNPMLAHADNYQFYFVDDPWFGSGSGWAKGSTDARCPTAQGTQTSVPLADVTANGQTDSNDGLPAITLLNGAATTTFRVENGPGTAWTLNGSMQLVSNGVGPVQTAATLGATCAGSNVTAISLDGVNWTVIGTLQTLNGPVAINQFIVGTLNLLYTCAEPCAPGHVHNVTAAVSADPVSPWAGFSTSYLELSASSWFSVDQVTP